MNFSKLKLKLCLALALLLIPWSAAFAQADSTKLNSLTIGLNLKAHGEVISGGLPADDAKQSKNSTAFILGRTRILANYSRPGLEVHTVLQNLAVWGTSGNQALKLYEGWAKLTSRTGLFAQIGRIALSYDDERIIGPNDFAMAAFSHDALRLGYEGKGHKLHTVLAFNQNEPNVYSDSYYVNGAQLYKNMQMLWYHYDVPVFPLGVSLLFMNFGLQSGLTDSETNPPKTVYQQMFGGYLTYTPERFSIEASYYRQTGRFVDVRYMQSGVIDAWMAAVKASAKVSDIFGLALGYDFLSGDDYVVVPSPGDIGTVWRDATRGFSPLYGSRTKFYGLLDYFYQSAYIHGFTPGLQNAYATFNLTPGSKFSGSATYHYLAVATKLKDLSSTLGHSMDLQLSYSFTKDISLSAGYTLMLGTETMDRLKQGLGSRHSHWGWFTLTISPSLFNFKW